jgi:hypothetical protein
MPKIQKIKNTEPGVTEFLFICPGCSGGAHLMRVQGPEPRWAWNGSIDAPTFSPSLLCRAGDHVCHSFIRDGKIEYLGDCTHELKGQTVEIPDWE